MEKQDQVCIGCMYLSVAKHDGHNEYWCERLIDWCNECVSDCGGKLFEVVERKDDNNK